MAVPFTKVTHQKEGITTDITHYVDTINIALGSDSKKSTSEISLNNNVKKLDNINFELDDDVVVYIDNQPIVSQDPIITTVIAGVSPTISGKGQPIKLKCADKTYLMLSKLWARSYTESEALKVDEVINNVISSTTEDSSGTGVSQITTNNVTSTKSDGTAFTIDVSLTKVWKPVYEWLKDLSTPTWTGDDRNYVFYVDKDNDLHWTYPFQKLDIFLDGNISNSDTTITVDSTLSYPEDGTLQIEEEQITYTGKTSTTFTGATRGANNTIAVSHTDKTLVSPQTITEGQNGVISIKFSIENATSFNFIIYNAGPTPSGYDLLWYQFDEGNADKEFRMKKKEWKDIGQDLRNKEKTRDDWPDVDDNFPTGSYPWTPHWSASSVADNSEYQSAYITEQKKVGGSRAVDQFFSVGADKLSADIEMRGNNNYRVNEVITLISDRQNINEKLRIKDIRHIVNKSGWFTSLKLVEDEGARTNGI